jgi:hypothetical protein
MHPPQNTIQREPTVHSSDNLPEPRQKGNKTVAGFELTA